jgi:hypothetical protein
LYYNLFYFFDRDNLFFFELDVRLVPPLLSIISAAFDWIHYDLYMDVTFHAWAPLGHQLILLGNLMISGINFGVSLYVLYMSHDFGTVPGNVPCAHRLAVHIPFTWNNKVHKKYEKSHTCSFHHTSSVYKISMQIFNNKESVKKDNFWQMYNQKSVRKFSFLLQINYNKFNIEIVYITGVRLKEYVWFFQKKLKFVNLYTWYVHNEFMCIWYALIQKLFVQIKLSLACSRSTNRQWQRVLWIMHIHLVILWSHI